MFSIPVLIYLQNFAYLPFFFWNVINKFCQSKNTLLFYLLNFCQIFRLWRKNKLVLNINLFFIGGKQLITSVNMADKTRKIFRSGSRPHSWSLLTEIKKKNKISANTGISNSKPSSRDFFLSARNQTSQFFKEFLFIFPVG